MSGSVVASTTKCYKRAIGLMDLKMTKYTPCIEKMNNLVLQQMNRLKQLENNETSNNLVAECLNKMILTEHHPTYTFTPREIELMSKDEEDRLQALGAEFATTDRGGLVTFHGPGQLIAYPVLNLRDFDMSIKEYVNNLEEVIIRMANKFNITAKRTDNIGVWVGSNKLAAIGIRNQKLITSHGTAINCNTDLKWFNHIVSCGLYGKGITSFTKESGKEITVDILKPVFLDEFQKVFDCEFEN